MTDDIFNAPTEDGKPNTDDKPVEASGTGLETYLELITKEDGTPKYSTAEEALKGAVHAQTHIATLETELKSLRENASKDVGMEKILEALNGKSEPNEEQTPTPSVSPDDIAQLVTQVMESRETETQKEQNIKTVVSKFKDVYGEKASEALYGKAEDLGLGREDINQLIATKPNAALKILGIENAQPASSDGIDLGGVNSAALQHKTDDEVKSSMGYVSGKELTDNWKSTVAKINEKYGIETP